MLWLKLSVHVLVFGLLWLLVAGAYEPDGWVEQRALKARSPQDCALCCEATRAAGAAQTHGSRGLVG